MAFEHLELSASPKKEYESRDNFFVNKKLIFCALSFLFLDLSSCMSVGWSGESPTPRLPVVTHHPVPDIRVATSWIMAGGCELNLTKRTCPPDSILGKLGCEEIQIRNLLGGFPYPIAVCINYGVDPPGPEFTMSSECYLANHYPQYEAYVMLRDEKYELLSGNEESISLFLPIDSPEEALSYAILTTDYYALTYIVIEPYYRYFVDDVEETYAVETQGGYFLHLFVDSEPVCGCDSHPTDIVDIVVSSDGQITLIKSQKFYEFDGCVD